MIQSHLDQTKFGIINSREYISLKLIIEELMEFLDSLSMLIFSNAHIKVCISGHKVHLLNTDLIDSAVKTLNSIEHCCIFGSFSDANTLIRKFRDDLILFLYILDVLNNRKYDEEKINEIVGDSIDIDKWIKAINLTLNIAINGNNKNDDDKCVDAWFDNKVHSLSKQQRRKLYFENYMTYLKKDNCIDKVIKKYNLEKDWENIRIKLNDYTHNNGSKYTQANLMGISLPEIKNCFGEISSRLSFITAFFMALLILIEPIMIQSTDYIDYVDCGLTPPDDSQYIVAPFIKDFINKYINKINPELKVFLKNNAKYGMLIE